MKTIKEIEDLLTSERDLMAEVINELRDAVTCNGGANNPICASCADGLRQQLDILDGGKRSCCNTDCTHTAGHPGLCSVPIKMESKLAETNIQHDSSLCATCGGQGFVSVELVHASCNEPCEDCLAPEGRVMLNDELEKIRARAATDTIDVAGFCAAFHDRKSLLAEVEELRVSLEESKAHAERAEFTRAHLTAVIQAAGTDHCGCESDPEKGTGLCASCICLGELRRTEEDE